MRKLAEMIICRKVPTVNETNRWRYKGWHWKLKKEKTAWRLLLLSEGRISKATRKRRVVITSVRKRRIDPDNIYASMKLLIDAMVGLGWIKDDGLKYLDLEVKQRNVKKDEPENTQIEIYELGKDK